MNIQKERYIPSIKRSIPTKSYVNILYNKDIIIYKELVDNLLHEKESSWSKTKEITINDIFSFIISKEQAEKILENKLNIGKHSKHYISETTKKLNKEGIVYFNSILHESIELYQRVFHETLYSSYLNKRDKDKQGLPICKNHEDVVNFLLHNANTRNDPTDRSHHCFLLKIMRVFNDFSIHQTDYKQAEENFEQIKRYIILPNFKTKKDQLAEDEENIDYMRIRTKTSVSNKPPIYFTMSSRIKEKERIILKMLGDSKYTSSKAIQDIYGIRNEMRNKEDAILLLEYFWKFFPGEIDHKQLLGINHAEVKKRIEEIEKKYTLDEDFVAILLNSILQKEKEGKPGRKNNKNYEDIKLKAKMRDENKKEHIVEIQINIVGNRNENGLSHHGVYEVKAIIEAEVRGKWFTTEEKIHYYINDIIEKNIEENEQENPDLLYLGGLDRNHKYHLRKKIEQDYFKRKTHEYIFDHIKNDFLKGRELEYPEKGKTRIYSTEIQRTKFHLHEKTNENIYPKDINRRE